MASGDARWKDLDITKDEVDRIGKALKDDKFRKMFVEYAEEIADPKNREIYEQEIAQMEADRGMDVQFIHPKPGHVVKIKMKSSGSPDLKKVFINICQSDVIGAPSHEKKLQQNGKMGLQWSIPHSFSAAKEDTDASDVKCSVYDVVFHPDTYKMASNVAFMKMIHDTAFDGLERQFGLTFERQTMVKLEKVKYKGIAAPTVLRTKKADTGKSGSESKSANKENDPLASFPYPYEKGVSSAELADKKAKQVEEDRKRKKARADTKQTPSEPTEADEGSITPTYTLTNQYGMDMADYSQSLGGTPMSQSNVPSALVISIHLPKLKSAAPCTLDVTERHLSLESTEPVKYKLSLKLPHPVDDDNGSAKFDKTKKRLVVTLPVLKHKFTQKIEEVMAESPEQLSDAVPDSADAHKPLIEEVPPAPESPVAAPNHITESAEGNQRSEQRSDQSQADPTSSDSGRTLELDSKIPYKTPKFSYDQDFESVNIVLEVPRVNTQTFKTAYHENTMDVVFSTSSPSGFPSHYYLKCSFPSSILDVTRNVGETNAVLSIVKTSAQFWDSFEYSGSDSEVMQEKKFLTKADIREELKHFECQQQKQTSESQARRDDFTAEEAEPFAEKLSLTIDIKSAQEPERNEEEMLVSPPEVVQNSLSPNIQGILKRTLSESSGDDLHCSGDSSARGYDVIASNDGSSSSSSSPTDLPSPRERKKSVSFSDKVEETMFKSKDSVCHMHKTLLNRRKKQRQRENRREGKQERIHRNSSTEHSSGDENSSKKRSGRRRRHSSSTSEDGTLSPRSPRTETMSSEGDHVCTCNSTSSDHNHSPVDSAPSEEPPEEEPAEEEPLNSDDDEEENQANHSEENSDSKNVNETNPVTNWSETSNFVDKTKCAFAFNNSVIFDLDE